MHPVSLPAIDRRALLVVLGGLHILAFLSFGPVKVKVESRKASFITLVPTPERKVVAMAAPPARSSVRPAPAVPRLPIPTAQDAPAMVLVPAPQEELPLVAPLEGQVMENARGKAGAIDKELREKSFDLRDRKKLAYEKPRFERMMEAAGKPRGDTIEEIVAPDGRKITRINGKCYYAQHANHSIMRDPFKGGPPLIIQANCPRDK